MAWADCRERQQVPLLHAIFQRLPETHSEIVEMNGCWSSEHVKFLCQWYTGLALGWATKHQGIYNALHVLLHHAT